MTQTRTRAGRFRRGWLLLLVALMVAGAACSDDGGGPPEITTLRVLMTDDWVTSPFVDAVRDFEHGHPNVRVSVEKGSIRHMPDAVRAGVNSGTPPDVVQGHAFSAASQGLAGPLDDLWPGRLSTGEYFPGAVEDVTWGGRIYGVPLDTNALVLIYNEDHLRAANVPVPLPAMTFAEFKELARALTPADGSRRALAMPTSTWWTHGWVAANGGELVTSRPDGTPQFSLDSPRAVEAIDFLGQLVREGLAFPPRAADVGSADALALFQAGQTSLLVSGSWELPKLRNASAGRFGTTLMPRGSNGSGGSAMGGSSLWVPKESKNRKLAFDFMVHLTSDKYALRFAKEEGRLPVRPRVLEDPYFGDPNLKAFLEQAKTARPETLGAFPGEVKLFARAIDESLRSGKDAGAALREAQTEAQAQAGRTASG